MSGRAHRWALLVGIVVPDGVAEKVAAAVAEAEAGGVFEVREALGEFVGSPVMGCYVCEQGWPGAEVCPGEPLGWTPDGVAVYAVGGSE